ncbi:glycosyltransferase [Brachybacterium sp. SGAir0954]|uniref:glycosyltransferase family protein n=1 Tax=Brachybacterium sp. SGAir0954 TaxID=2571029 RepID=UPI0010CCC500|nr:glycosyltransferase [Brachybacterium sp. SGAir0954]QCR52980.1 glycosyltransferase [Brachybacterium sp. SGAir0954]
MPGIGTSLQTLRTGLWHLRTGGVSQLRTWNSRRKIVRHGVGDGLGSRDAEGRLSFPPKRLMAAAPHLPEMRAAVILDDFSMLAWSHEMFTVAVTPQGWQEQLAAAPVDLLLVESAWHGNSDAWQYQLTGSAAPSAPLRELVDHCREQGIPTVFWNKEDPPHFEDFLETAKLFDQVFTSDVTLLPRYREELGHEGVAVLPFAAQSAVHNPVRPHHGHQVRDVAFAGMYFAHKFPERRAQMDLLLGGALDASRTMRTGLEIFSRFLGDDERYQFPGELGERVVGSLSYDRMLTAYQAYKVFLNVNSVVTSPSMCARRIFEITASGTPVVSTPSPAIEQFFPPDEVPVVTDRDDAAHVVRALVRSPELRDRTVHRAQRRIWNEHTYTHRTRQVLESVGLGERAGRLGLSGAAGLPSVSALAATNRPGQIDHLLTQFAGQTGVQRQLIVTTHGFGAERSILDRARELGIEDVSVREAPQSWTLGACLNAAVERADGDVLSKMDDDDIYGPHYLHDLLHARAFSGADVVGKHAHYMYLAGTDATLLRFPWMEHRFTDRVMGPTITAGRDVFGAHPFADISRGEDSTFLSDVVAAGGKVYSADRFSFTQMRHGESGGHAWSASDRELLASADVAWFGRNDAHVMV